VLVVLGFVLALVAAGWPLAGLARLSVIAGTGGVPLWTFAPFGRSPNQAATALGVRADPQAGLSRDS